MFCLVLHTQHTGAQEGGPCFGAAAMQGWRVRMEDAHVANLTLGDPAQRLSLFGVFDGHVRPCGWWNRTHHQPCLLLPKEL